MTREQTTLRLPVAMMKWLREQVQDEKGKSV